MLLHRDPPTALSPLSSAVTATAWMTTTAWMTAAAYMTDSSTAAAISSDASTTNVAAAIIAVATIVGAVDIAAVVEIAVATDHPAQHAGNHSADDRFGNDIATIPNLLNLRVGLYQFRAGYAGDTGNSGRRHKHHPSADNCCNSNTIHLMVPFL